jgi:hypothetical protein
MHSDKVCLFMNQGLCVIVFPRASGARWFKMVAFLRAFARKNATILSLGMWGM